MNFSSENKSLECRFPHMIGRLKYMDTILVLQDMDVACVMETSFTYNLNNIPESSIGGEMT